VANLRRDVLELVDLALRPRWIKPRIAGVEPASCGAITGSTIS